MIFKKIVLFFILLTIYSSLVALNPDKKLNHFIRNSFTIDNGFPQTSVYSICQTYDGYLFFATAAGLVRYNGKEFKVYKKKNSKHLSGDWIFSLAEDKEHVLWVGIVSEGLVRYKDGKFLATKTPKKLMSGYIYKIFVDKDNNIWFLHSKSGVIKYNGKKYESIKDNHGNIVIANSIKEVSNNDIYIGARTGFYKLDNNNFLLTPNTQEFNINDFEEISKGTILFSHKKPGLKIIKNDVISDFKLNYKNIKKDIVYQNIYKDSDASVWIGTYNEGVFRYYNGKTERLYHKENASASMSYIITEDNDKNIYIGSHDYGFTQLKDGLIYTIGKDDGLKHSSIHTLTFDKKDNLYMSHEYGISIYKDKKIINYEQKENPMIPKSIKTLKFQDNNLYLGFRKKEYFLKFDSDLKNISYPLKSFNIEGATSSYIIGEEIYFINKFGITIIDENKKIKQKYLFKKKKALVINTFKDRKNRLWLAFMGGNVAYLDLKTNKLVEIKYKNKNLPYSFMFYEDEDGTVWIPSYGNGIYAYKDNEVLNLNSKDNFPEDSLYAISEDNKNNLWFSNNWGLLKISRKEILKKMINKKSSLNIKRYGKQDGMLSDECNGGFSNSVAKNSNGKIYFATTKGVAVVDTNKKGYSISNTPMKIESIIVDNKKNDFNPKFLKISPNKKRITFSFALLTYSFVNKIEYFYKLIGYDNNWIKTNKNEVSYTNLNAGNYKFEVKAKIKGEKEFSKVAITNIKKEAHYYEKTWFFVFIIIIIIIFIFIIFQYRIYFIKKRQKELEFLVEAKTKQIKEMALSDALTNLRNRKFFYETVNDELNNFIEQKDFEINRTNVEARYFDKYYGFLMFDIDFFKKVNDELGHNAGDKILKQFSDILKSSVRKDDYVIRWGGEEFLVILKYIKPDKIFDIACKIKDKIENYDFTYNNKGNIIKKTCSIGSVTYPMYPNNPNLLTFEETLEVADLGLYYSKNNGRNMTVHINIGENFSSEISIDKLLKNFYDNIEKKVFKLKIYQDNNE